MMRIVRSTAVLAALWPLLVVALPAQHAAFRIKGRVKTDAGQPVANAEVRLAAFYGYGAGTFASLFLIQRDFDSASRAFDAARNRTRDKDEQQFISTAIGERAAIKYR